MEKLQQAEETYIQGMKELIGMDSMEAVIERLKDYARGVSRDFENSIIMQSGRLAGLNKRMHNGLIGDSSYTVSRNQIRHALLYQLDSIAEERKLQAFLDTFDNKLRVKPHLNTLDPAGFEKVFGREELFEINWLQKATTASKAICKVLLPSGKAGTGFLLKGGYLMTNYHVLTTRKQVQNAKIILDYRVDAQNRALPNREYSLSDEVFLRSNELELDFSLTKIVASTQDLSDYGYLQLDTFADPQIDEKVNIIQHPEGGSMKIALPDKTISVWKQYLFYLADTKPGSSGSPVFNQDWKVIALHHAGKDENSRKGGLQINEAGEVKPSNRGILIKNILAYIKEQEPAIVEQIT